MPCTDHDSDSSSDESNKDAPDSDDESNKDAPDSDDDSDDLTNASTGHDTPVGTTGVDSDNDD